MEKEEARLRGELAKARRETEAKIDGIIREGSRGADEWGKLDGAKLTADAQLLQGQGVTPEQFDQLYAYRRVCYSHVIRRPEMPL